MADIVIRGMEMPKDRPVCVYIWPDGRVFPSGLYKTNEWDGVKAIPLPEGHGRLIDADEIESRINRKMSACKPNAVDELTYLVCIDIVDHADPIVPAEGGGE